jgi:SAM-dependent methyltransferase/uncharacterized protein YbaR (Trm112 family)
VAGGGVATLTVNSALLNYLACPACGSECRTARSSEEGTIVCVGCGRQYPVRHGIPRFPIGGSAAVSAITQRTSEMYRFAWKRFGKPSVEKRWEKDSERFTSLIPRELISGAGRTGLDAGCGAGLDLITMADGGAELIGLDVSAGIDVAADLLRNRPNVHLVQGDLNALPFKKGKLDFVYSFGVLHHLADTRAGFMNLARLLKPGGALIVYLYERFDDRTRAERTALSVVGTFRAMTTRLPARGLLALCWLLVPFVWATCSVPAAVLRRIAPGLEARVPFRHTMRWTVLVSDLFDRFSPPVERRYTADEIKALYRDAGLVDVEIRRYRGWVAWGSVPGAVD